MRGNRHVLFISWSRRWCSGLTYGRMFGKTSSIEQQHLEGMESRGSVLSAKPSVPGQALFGCTADELCFVSALAAPSDGLWLQVEHCMYSTSRRCSRSGRALTALSECLMGGNWPTWESSVFIMLRIERPSASGSVGF